MIKKNIKKISRKKFLFFMIIFYLALYIIFKLLLVYFFDLFNFSESYEKKYNPEKVLKIEKYSKEKVKETEYFESNENMLNIKKIDKKFELIESYQDEYTQYEIFSFIDSDKTFLILGVTDSNLNRIFREDEASIYSELNYFPIYISDISKKFYLKKNLILDDVDLLKYIRVREKKISNFLTPIYKIKENYFFNYIESSLPDMTDITFLEGDYRGFIYEGKNLKQVILIQNHKNYFISFYDLDYFTDETILDIINSVIIK